MCPYLQQLESTLWHVPLLPAAQVYTLTWAPTSSSSSLHFDMCPYLQKLELLTLQLTEQLVLKLHQRPVIAGPQLVLLVSEVRLPIKEILHQSRNSESQWWTKHQNKSKRKKHVLGCLNKAKVLYISLKINKTSQLSKKLRHNKV